MSHNRASQRIVSFGEAMIRFTPPGNERLERVTSLDLTVGGAELNTAVGLTCLGYSTEWVTALPDSGPGRLVARQARANGVAVNNIHWVGEDEGRTGLYFLEEGVDPRPSAVTYDRKNTAISQINEETFDWEHILQGAAAFHVSGITMALSPGARRAAMRAVETACRLGVLVSFDLNYRSKLWSEADARDAFVQVVPMVDVLFASRGALGTFFGIDGSREEVMRGALQRLGVAAVSISRKKAKGSRGLTLQNLALGPSGVLAESASRDIEVVDRLGGGDAFAAGFLAGYLENPAALSYAVELGAAASALKHTIPGDFLCATRAEIEAAMTAEGAGVLQR